MPPSPARQTSIDRFRFQPDEWLWCLHCERFFQGRDARADFLGGMQACAFKECDAAGYQVDIFEWDAWLSDNPRLRAFWPEKEQLHKGLVASLDSGREPFPTTEQLRSDPHAYGVGEALNQDVVRRDEIFGTCLEPENGDRRQFDDLDLAKLEMLVQEGFLKPESRLPFYPSADRVMALLREWPQFRASGHVTKPDRPVYAVWIDTLQCATDSVAVESRDRLVEQLERLFPQASDVGDYGDEIGAWWY